MPIFLLDRYETAQLRELAASEVDRETLRITSLAAGRQRELSEGSRQLLIALAQLPEVRGLDGDECNPLVQSLLQQYPIYTNIGVADANGNVICSGLPLTGPATANDRSWFQRAIAERSFAAGEYQVGRIAGEAAQSFAYPVLGPDATVVAVVYTAMRLDWLDNFTAEAGLPPGSVLMAFDRDGNLLRHHPSAGHVGTSIRDSPLFTEASSRREGTTRVTDDSGVARLVGFAPLAVAAGDDQAYIAVGIDETLAFAQAHALERSVWLIQLLALLFLVVVVFGLERRVLQPVRALLGAMERLRAGDLSARTGLGYSGGEVGQLGRAFDEMAASRQGAEERIASLNASLQRRIDARTRALTLAMETAQREHSTVASVLASMSDGVILMDAESRIRYCNARASELLGIDSVLAVGKTAEEVFDLIDHTFLDPASALASWSSSLNHAEKYPSFEVAIAGPPRRDIRVDLFPVSPAEGQDGGVGSLLHDVTGERELSRVKDELVSVVSHELRTPLASLVGFANLLLTRDLDEAKRRQFLGIIADEGHRLTALINDFLDLQRMESGHAEITPAAVEVGPLLQRAIASADDGVHSFHLELPDHLPLARTDAGKVQQVLANLLSNACKYSPQARDITICAESSQGQIKFSIADRGLGVPAEALPHLFDKFFRVDNSDRRKIKGTGLGLAICKQIVSAHGGRIWAESDGLGLGTRVKFTLPVMTETPACGDVLIVEDDVGFAQLVEAELRAEGLSASRVESAEVGIERLTADPPRAMVLDLMLPGMSGEALLELVRDSRAVSIPVVVMSVKDLTVEEREALIALGASSVVQKGPTSASLAAKTIAMALSQTAAREERAA